MKKKGSDSVTALDLERVTTASFIHNSDGDGAYFSSKHTIIKSAEKVDYTALTNAVHASSMVLTHQRLATNGDVTDANAQPFKTKRWVLAHNGVLDSDLIGEDESDSARFFRSLIEKGLPNNKRKQVTTGQVKRVIERAFKRYSGSFSVALYDSAQERLYYFKNASTRISCFKLEEGGYYLSTDRDGTGFLGSISEERKLEARTLYCFTLGARGWVLVNAGGFALPVPTYQPGYYQSAYPRNAGKGYEPYDYECDYSQRDELVNLWKRDAKPLDLTARCADKEAK